MEAINVDDLMEEIRAEVKRRKAQGGDERKIAGDPWDMKKFALDAAQESPSPEYKEGGSRMDDFLNYHDEAFVTNAYLRILGRAPDQSALDHFLSNLRSGRMTKPEVLGRLRYSAEGREKHANIQGLFWIFVIQSSFKIPILGYVMRLVTAIFNLPKIVRNFQVLEGGTLAQLKHQEHSLIGVSNGFQLKIDGIQSRIDGIQPSMDGIQSRIDGIQPSMDGIQSRIDGIQSSMDAFLTKTEGFQSTIDEMMARHGNITSVLEQKADASELMERLKYKADLWLLEALKEQKADHAALEEVAAQKADREELAELNEKKVGREELVAVSEAKADVKDLVAMGERKADREEIVALNEKKVGREELAELNEKKVGREELVGLSETLMGQIRTILDQLKDHKLNLVDQERRLRLLLEEARRRLPEDLSREQIEKMVAEEDQMLSAMYVGFEDKFRGTRHDIKKRQKAYLPSLEAAGAGTSALPIVDVGCGRGEWLELLKENDFTATGVDNNQVMQRACQELGLQVELADAIEFLRQQDPNTLGAVTGFHIVEHLPTSTMVTLFDEALRVLKPGGIVIFETPNPENILVGSCNFYTDPTHKRPIPPHTLAYLIENRGFVEPEIVRSSPLNYARYEGDDAVKHIFHRFNMEQDYAVIARKPS